MHFLLSVVCARDIAIARISADKRKSKSINTMDNECYTALFHSIYVCRFLPFFFSFSYDLCAFFFIQFKSVNSFPMQMRMKLEHIIFYRERSARGNNTNTSYYFDRFYVVRSMVKTIFSQLLLILLLNGPAAAVERRERKKNCTRFLSVSLVCMHINL